MLPPFTHLASREQVTLDRLLSELLVGVAIIKVFICPVFSLFVYFCLKLRVVPETTQNK